MSVGVIGVFIFLLIRYLLSYQDEEEEEEPEVDLSTFLARQRLDDKPSTSCKLNNEDDDDIDLSLHSKFPKRSGGSAMKGQTQQIHWSKDLDELKKQKDSADAVRGTSLLRFTIS